MHTHTHSHTPHRYRISLISIIWGKKIVITFVGLDNGTNSLCRYVLDGIDQAPNHFIVRAKYIVHASVPYVYSIYWIKCGEYEYREPSDELSKEDS